MEQIHTVQEMILRISDLHGKSVGFVPTMGALHQGHLNLIQNARKENEIVVLSIFVNPTQFNNTSDFSKYPKTLIQDLSLAKAAGVDYVFTPDESDLYPDKYRFKMTENDFSKKLCGHHRPGHFDGVLSVVLKFFNIIKPDRAYFGEKDFQQFSLIHDMAAAFFVPVQIKMVETTREFSGLALSSRNLRLSPEQKSLAAELYKTLSEKITASEASKKLETLGFKVDYVEDHNERRFAAVVLGDVRLIDNVKI